MCEGRGVRRRDMMVGYTAKVDPDVTAKAIGNELPISRKNSVEICRAIRGMMVEDAKKYLEDVIAGKRAVRFRRYNKQVAHKKGKGFGGGRYPKKAAEYILKTIENAQENAEYSGLDSESMRIAVIAAHRGRVIEGYMPRAHGRSTQWDEETTNIEVILEEVEEL